MTNIHPCYHPLGSPDQQSFFYYSFYCFSRKVKDKMSEDPEGSKIIPSPIEDRKKSNLVPSPIEKMDSRALDGLRGFASIHVMVSKAQKLLGPGGFVCCHPLQCVAGHCYYQLSVFFLSFFLFLLHLLFLTHFGESPEAENWFPLIFWHN